MDEWIWERTTLGIEKQKNRIFFAHRTEGINLRNGHHASTHKLPELWDRRQGYLIDDWGPESMAEFLDEARGGNNP